jgi:hypothetical protein
MSLAALDGRSGHLDLPACLQQGAQPCDGGQRRCYSEGIEICSARYWAFRSEKAVAVNRVA